MVNTLVGKVALDNEGKPGLIYGSSHGFGQTFWQGRNLQNGGAWRCVNPTVVAESIQEFEAQNEEVQ